ncbi:MAG: hypothetical protein RIB45_10005 [Marivibrio sp.]|uniref:hypothetical protein n=1 Tax=Marivibrio sp. TaxID=2039719 RepID=UPI0032EC128C
MPTKYKLILSVIVLAVAAGAFRLQQSAGFTDTPWVIAGLGVFMVFAIWLFPETRKQK